MATIDLVGITKRFGETTVLENLDLQLHDGEFAVIVGPSGCGKSTLLRLIAGIESVTAGAILIDGDDVARVHPGKRDVAMVFQDYALYPHMTIEKNLSFGMRARREGSKTEIGSRVREVAATLKIDDYLGRKPAQLSGGQRQRVALGRAMMREPRAYLMDEPLSNLDAALRVQVREDLIQFHRDTEGTILFVTHDQVEAMTMGERVIVMNGGVIQQSGPPADIYDRPANAFVATFVGSPQMNILPATAEPDGGSTVVRAGDLMWRYGSTAIELPTELIVGFRPEAVVGLGDPGRTRSTNASGDDTVFNRHVDFVENIGHEAIVRLGTARDRILARVGAAEARSLRGSGDYAVSRHDVHLFDAETSRALTHGDERHHVSSADDAVLPLPTAATG